MPTKTSKPMTPFDATVPEEFTGTDRKNLELTIHEFVNAQRREHSINPLNFNEDIAYVARTKSRDMAIKGYFAHKEPDGDWHTDRLEEYGYEWDLTAENIVKPTASPNTPISRIAEQAVRALMSSPTHREEILLPSYTLEGIGSYVTSDYTIYVTQIFDT